MSSNPPPGVQSGGQWGTVTYSGEKTQLCCIILCLLTGIFSLCGTLAYSCPRDEKDGYRLGDTVYDHRGTMIGPISDVKFVAGRAPPPAHRAAAPPASAPAKTTREIKITPNADGSQTKKTIITTVNADGSKSVTEQIEHIAAAKPPKKRPEEDEDEEIDFGKSVMDV